ncbi:hypothetical protein FNJ87_01425 [Nonlabens mediterrranea]|uniref:Peptidase A2 domain-containing protein n=1 Tax=Nonlabens mediterrranea TaxID=1419947 RepID=A0ABS0A393_9FLAO|nr:hypothetical protein [Nonlabens mediterrranea]
MKKLLLLLMISCYAVAKDKPVPIWLETPVSFPKATKLSEHTVRIPFQLVGNLITVEASVNGQSGPFIIDTGAYNMVLNKRIYQANSNNHKTTYSVNQELHQVPEMIVHDFIIDDFEINARLADLVDLSNMERSKRSKINGILGYENLRRYEIFIDFYLEQITLFKINSKGNRLDEKLLTDQITDTLQFNRKGHSIVLESQLNGVEISFVLDTGAEINQLSSKVDVGILSNFDPLRRVEMVGMDGQGREVIAGNFMPFQLSNSISCEMMPTIITTMKFSRQAYGTKVDAVLGYWFLKNRRIIINYRKKSLYFALWPQ